MRDHILLAPFDGVLGFRRVSLGAYVQLGQQVATLVDDSEMRLEFGVPSIYIGELKVGVKIEARTADVPDRVFEGKLTSVDNAIDPVTRAVKVRATLPNREGLMRGGMFMTVDMSPKSHPGLAVPEISAGRRRLRQFRLPRRPDQAARRRGEDAGDDRHPRARHCRGHQRPAFGRPGDHRRRAQGAAERAGEGAEPGSAGRSGEIR